MGRFFKDGFQLFPEQIELAKGLSSRKRAILIDSTGNGKTLVCLYSYSYLKSKGLADCLLVLTPKNAYDKRVWAKDAAAHTHLTSISLDDFIKKVSGGADVLELLNSYDVVYGKHTHCKTDYGVLRQIYMSSCKLVTVLDEVHAFKNSKAQLTSTMSLLVKNCYALWGVTATVLSKNCMDTYHLVNFVYPRFFTSVRGFQSQFCKIEEKIIGRNPDKTLRKARIITDYKDSAALMDYLRPVMIVGTPPVPLDIHFIDYTMSDSEQDLYAKVAQGLMLSGESDDATWIQQVLSRSEIREGAVRSVKDLERHSSRFIYLQAVTDGCLNPDGTFGVGGSRKLDSLLTLVSDIASRNESVLVYFDFYSSLDAAMYHLQRSGITDSRGRSIVVVESSSRNVLKSTQATESQCFMNSYVILCTRAASESANYTYINNVVLFDVPVTPIPFLQFIGRITRKTSKFLGDLHLWIFRSDDISEYKLQLVGFKVYMQEKISFEIHNFPREYVKPMSDAEHLRVAKKHLLWKDRRPRLIRSSQIVPQGGTLF